MHFKNSLISSFMSSMLNLLLCRCPNCGKTDMFKSSAFNLLHFIEMRDSCDQCHLNFHPEPGYYLGAMYISYVINSFIFLAVALTVKFKYDFTLTNTFLLLGILSFVLLPYTLRFSRTLWLFITKNVEEL